MTDTYTEPGVFGSQTRSDEPAPRPAKPPRASKTSLKERMASVATSRSREHAANSAWEIDSEERRQRSERRAWMVAGAATLVAVLEGVGLAASGPLRQTIPLPVVVDRTTGETTITQRLSSETIPAIEQMDAHNVQEYVKTRERYLWQFIQQDRLQVARTSTRDAFADYNRMFRKGHSIVDELGRKVEWRVDVINVRPVPTLTHFGKSGQYVVTFDKTVFDVERDIEVSKTRYVSTVMYVYEPTVERSELDARANPFAFLTTGYRRDEVAVKS